MDEDEEMFVDEIQDEQMPEQVQPDEERDEGSAEDTEGKHIPTLRYRHGADMIQKQSPALRLLVMPPYKDGKTSWHARICRPRGRN